MRKIIVFTVLLVSFSSEAQSVTVNTTTYTVDQLVNNILINSPCVSGTNVVAKTGTDYGSVNGIGYFENNNPNFPFLTGVVLTTGDVTKIPSPNNTILNDGTAAWTGDSDLETNLLSQSGISINSINASYIEFDFQPKTPNFDFSFLFASEEYGTSQCNFSDAFAFLLKDVTSGGANTNLAVIPSTSTPVSVETIRNMTYNSDCPSANEGYFGSFNSSGFGPAINFNGETVEMIASATGLDTNHIYRIKIVIADGGANTGYDSAIFLKADSFNIGQNVLGLDYTQDNISGICPGNTLPILSAAGLSPGTTFVWKKEGIAFLPAQTAETLDLNAILPVVESGIHNYSVTYLEPGCIAFTDEISIEIYPKIGVIATVANLYSCDTGATNYTFDLSQTTTIILAGVNQATTASGLLDDLPAETLISYYDNNTDAVTNSAALNTTYTLLNSNNGKPIYVRIENPVTSCYEIKSFQLQIVPSPVIANTPNDITLCGINLTDVPPKALFDFTAQKALILGAQDPAYNIISFHTTAVGATNNTNILALNTANEVLSGSRTIYVRVQNISNLNCYVTTNFKITVTPLPEVDLIDDVYVCPSFSLPPLTKPGAQYWTGPGKTGIQLPVGYTVTTTSVIYVFNQIGACANEDFFNVTIVVLNNSAPNEATYCTQYILPELLYGKYYTQIGGTSTPDNIELPAGTIINTEGVNSYYVTLEFPKTTLCDPEQLYEITIIPFTPLPDYTNIFDCTSYTLPADPNGGVYYSGSNKGLPILDVGTVINTTTTIYIYKETGTDPTNCTSEKALEIFIGSSSITVPTNVNSCTSYELPTLSVGEYRTAAGGGGLEISAGTFINTDTSLWYYVAGGSCIIDSPFTITVTIPPLPGFEDTPPQCDIYYLQAVTHDGNYYTGPLGTGKLRPVGYPITSTRTMYFYNKAATNPCYVEEDFIITIYKSPKVDAKPVEVIKCGQPYVLDNLVNGEYYEFAGGPSPTNPILPPGYAITSSKTIYVYAAASAPNTCISEYSISVLVTYVNDIADKYACDSFSLPTIIGQGDYYTAPNGPHGTGVKLTPPYTPITTTTPLYVYAEDNSRVSCSDEDTFTVTIYNTPVIAAIPPITRCESFALPAFTAPATRYFTQPGGPSNGNTEKFPGDLITVSSTIYAYAESGTVSTQLCTDEEPMEITITEKPKAILNVPPICHDFETDVLTNSYIISGFTAPQYAFEWKKEDGTIVGTTSDFSTNEPGNYTLTVTNTSIFGCTADPVPFTVIESAGPSSINFETSGWFSDNQTITVNAVPSIGNGSNFLYSLDGGSPQVSNIFTNVISGNHEISISDTNGCGETIPVTIHLINSPKFFTPNGDGYNETWKIIGLPIEDKTVIYIFNRYGKLLKELDPNGSGWDGNYNGNPLPSDDYWFLILYTENNVALEYRSHFSLKR